MVPEQPDNRDWRSRTQLPAQAEEQQVRLPQTEFKAQPQAQAPQAAPQAPQRQKPTAQQQLSGAGAPSKETVSTSTVMLTQLLPLCSSQLFNDCQIVLCVIPVQQHHMALAAAGCAGPPNTACGRCWAPSVGTQQCWWSIWFRQGKILLLVLDALLHMQQTMFCALSQVFLKFFSSFVLYIDSKGSP